MNVDARSSRLPWTYTRDQDVDDAQIDGWVEEGLFGARAETRIGRYVLGNKLGQGGMGAVYEALDEELDRKVAIKVIRRIVDERTHDKAKGEAHALARLNHPNVVAIHDVGLAHRRVWMAMELVDGSTLAAWAAKRRRGWAECLRVLTDAARGVAAAHAANIVHSDLKPTNVMIGEDDRVRVLDFGLAFGSAMTAGDATEPDLPPSATSLTKPAIAGTPAYMAPEQLRGDEVRAAADQFGWSVMAWELLFGARPYAGETFAAIHESTLAGVRRPTPRGRRVPRWLRRVIERGFALDPKRRWPNMQALLDALARGQRRARMGALIGVLAVLGALVTSASLWLAGPDPAADAERAWDGIWDRDSAAAVRAGFMAAAPEAVLAAKTWEQVHELVDLYVYKWRTAYRGAEAHQRTCLEERRAEMRSFLAELAAPGPATVVHAIEGAIGLTPIETCARKSVPPIDDFAHAERLRAIKAMQQVGRYVDALREIEALTEQAARAGDPTLTSQVLLVHGTVLRNLGRFTDAEQVLWRAFTHALRVHDDGHAAESGLAWLEVLGGDLMRTVDAEKHVPLIEGFLQRAESPKLRVVRLHRLEAEFRGHLGSYQDAADRLQGVLAELEDIGIEGELERIEILLSLADMSRRGGSSARAQPFLDEAQARWDEFYGADHPGVARLHILRGQIINGYPRADLMFPAGAAVREFERARDIARASGSYHLIGAAYNDLQHSAHACHASLAACERGLADSEQAVEAWQTAYGPVHPRVAIARGNHAKQLVLLERVEEAERELEQVVNLLAATVGTDHPAHAFWRRELAKVYVRRGKAAAAVPLLEQTAATTRQRRGRNVDTMHATYELGMGYLRTKRLDEAASQCAESLLIAEEYDVLEPYYVLAPQYCLGMVRAAQGDPGRALQAFATARTILDRLATRHEKFRFVPEWEEMNLWHAYTLRMLGRHDEAERIRRAAVRAYRRAGRMNTYASARRWAREFKVSL